MQQNEGKSFKNKKKKQNHSESFACVGAMVVPLFIRARASANIRCCAAIASSSVIPPPPSFPHLPPTFGDSYSHQRK
jgi:tetrahydrodipicolinate N-succinyltransferase